MTDSTEIWTYEAVEARLIDGKAVSRQMPDRERSWLHVKAYWPDMREADIFDYPGGGVDGVSHIRIRPLPLTPAQISEADEAGSWLGRFLKEGERRLMVLALGWPASGRRVAWKRVGRLLRVKLTGPALERQYKLAICVVTCGLNGKGRAAARRMLQARLHGEARALVDAGGAGGVYTGRVRGRRRRVTEVDIVYAE